MTNNADMYGRLDTTGSALPGQKMGVVNPTLFPHDHAFPSAFEGTEDTFRSAEELAQDPAFFSRYTPIQPGWTSGQLYCPKGGSTSTRSFADGDLYLLPFVVRSAASFDRIRIDITTNGTGSTVFRLGIWEHDSTTGRPGTLNLDAGTVSGTSVAVVTASIALTFSTPCLVWLGAAAQSVTGSPVLRGIVAGNGGGQGVVFDNTNGSGGGMNTYKYSGVTGAFSDLTATTPTATNSAPIIWLKAA